MGENAGQNNADSGQPKDTWQDVGREFEQLGGSIAQAFRSAWNDEENRRRAKEMQIGLESMIKEIGDAIRDTAESPKGQQIRDEAIRAADTLVNAGEQTAQEVRPHLVSALKQVNSELHKLVQRIEGRSASDEKAGGTDPSI